MNKEKLIQKFVENNIPINKWDKKELDQLDKLLKKEIKGSHDDFKFGTTNEKTGEWKHHKSNLNFLSGSSLNIEFKFKSKPYGPLLVGETYKPEPKLIDGIKLIKGDQIGALEIDGRYQYGDDAIFQLLSNLKPKSKIKIFFQRLKTGVDLRFCILETQSFDDRIEMMKNKFKITDKLNVEKKLKEWKGSLFV